jgi:hypothetical protein
MDHADEKLEALATYVMPRLGASDLQQLGLVLYLAEFGHMRSHGEGLTDHPFIRTADGPLPQDLPDLIAR